jgi:hypothetical protein
MCGAMRPTTFSSDTRLRNSCGKCTFFVYYVKRLGFRDGVISVSRADDVIVLSSGEKTVPSLMETIIGCCPYVNGAIMFGRERSQVGVLVQPSVDHLIDVDDEEQVAQFRNRIW